MVMVLFTVAKWLAKQWTTDIVTIHIHPRLYTGITHATKFKYKAALCIQEEYKENMCYSVTAFSTCLNKDLLIDLEIDGIVIYNVQWNRIVTSYNADDKLYQVDNKNGVRVTMSLN